MLLLIFQLSKTQVTVRPTIVPIKSSSHSKLASETRGTLALKKRVAVDQRNSSKKMKLDSDNSKQEVTQRRLDNSQCKSSFSFYLCHINYSLALYLGDYVLLYVHYVSLYRSSWLLNIQFKTFGS